MEFKGILGNVVKACINWEIPFFYYLYDHDTIGHYWLWKCGTASDSSI